MNHKISEQAQSAYQSKTSFANLDIDQKNSILKSISNQLELNTQNIIQANEMDVETAKKAGLNDALIDRLTINEATIAGMCASIEKIINLPDPCNQILDTIKHRNGMKIEKVSVPIGVIAIIYESRPNVTLDAAVLCIKSGNCVILKGGKEAVNSNREIYNSIQKGLYESINNIKSLNSHIVQFIDSTDRQDTLELLKQDQYIDIIIPRGGKGLIDFISNNTKIPVIKHLHGICHSYIDKDADIDMACNIIINAKCQRPGVCNAMETLLIHQEIAKKLFKKLLILLEQNNVEIRVCQKTKKILDIIQDTVVDKNYNNKIKLALEEDWTTEYLDYILSVKTIENLEQAINHINHYGSNHSDCIVSNNQQAAERFMNSIDSAAVYHNASTRFTDGEEFGMGAEMGISTDKLHARGPVGLKELTTYKYKIYGDGQTR